MSGIYINLFLAPFFNCDRRAMQSGNDRVVHFLANVVAALTLNLNRGNYGVVARCGVWRLHVTTLPARTAADYAGRCNMYVFVYYPLNLQALLVFRVGLLFI